MTRLIARLGPKVLVVEHIIGVVRTSVPAVGCVSTIDHATMLAYVAAAQMAWCWALIVVERFLL